MPDKKILIIPNTKGNESMLEQQENVPVDNTLRTNNVDPLINKFGRNPKLSSIYETPNLFITSDINELIYKEQPYHEIESPQKPIIKSRPYGTIISNDPYHTFINSKQKGGTMQQKFDDSVIEIPSVNRIIENKKLPIKKVTPTKKNMPELLKRKYNELKPTQAPVKDATPFNEPKNISRKSYFQQGGQMQQQDILQQIIQLVQAAMQGDQKATQTIQQVMQAAEQGDQQAQQIAQMIQQVIEQMKGLATMAKWGSKLEYIKSLKYAKGGKTCPSCQKRKNTFMLSNKVEEKACGGKTKKR